MDFAGRKGDAIPHQHEYNPANKGFGEKTPLEPPVPEVAPEVVPEVVPDVIPPIVIEP